MKKALWWILTVFLSLGALAYMPSIASVVFFAAAVYAAPIKPLREFIHKLIPKSGIRKVIAAALAVLCVVTVPHVDTDISASGDQEAIATTEATSTVGSTEEAFATTDIATSAMLVSSEPIGEAKTPETTEQQKQPIETTTAPIVTTEPLLPAVPPQDSTFNIHFIDVGQADAALVECDGHYMLIDGGNKADSNTLYSVLKKAQVPKLDIVVGTHAHEDHIGGLPGAFNYTMADLTLCPVTSYTTDAFEDFANHANKSGGGITIPSVGDKYSLGSATVEILGVNSTSESNDTSIVLMIRYGETSFLFTGDAEREAEQAILNSGVDLSATVLKVGHHGSDTSTTYPFLREIMPKYAVISVGEDNTYGHPTEATLSRLRDADVRVYRTDMQGDIYCTSDGKTVTMTVEKNATADMLSNAGDSVQVITPVVPIIPETTKPTTQKEQEPAPADFEYILNTNTKKFHYPNCSSVKQMKETNKDYFIGTRDEVIGRGYKPCGNCKP